MKYRLDDQQVRGFQILCRHVVDSLVEGEEDYDEATRDMAFDALLASIMLMVKGVKGYEEAAKQAAA